jgi:tetratricopeptide (TPR) repeat protein
MLDGNNKSGISVRLDRALLYSMFSLTQTMDESGDFDAVELLDVSQNSSTNYYARQSLSANKVQNLLQIYQVDALLVLNQLVLYDVLEAFQTDDGGQYAYIQAFAQSHWSMYFADASRRSQTLSYADTLIWESKVEYTRTQALNQLPNREDALLYLASTLGEGLGKSFVHSWVTVSRYLYDIADTHIEAGLQSFRYQRWEEAIHHWKQVANEEAKGERLKVKGKDNKAAAVAAANIAIAYEMLGDYSSACDYANEASRLFGALKTAWGRQQQVNIRYYLEQVRAKQAKASAQ